jgi:signal transduction histidine kinase
MSQSHVEELRAEQMAALGQLAAGMAHELRNPLTAMKLLIQNAVKVRPANGLTDRDLEVLETEATRLERSLQTFLDFARPPAPEKRAADVCQDMGQSLELIRDRADRQGVQIRCELADRPLVIEADHEQLRQVLLNLLCNALDTLPQGGSIRTTVADSGPTPEQNDELASEECTNRPTSWITIMIADNGPGVPKDLGDRIFEPYVSTKDTGVGLGLAICRRIVHSHGGTIIQHNAPEGGAVFTIHLPTSAHFEQYRAEVPA